MTKWVWKEILRAALRIFGYLIAFGFIGFMFIPALMGASPALRIPLVGALIAAAILLVFMDGATRGEHDSGMTEKLDELAASGSYDASPEETARRYWRPKGIMAALVAVLPLLLVAIVLSLMTQPYAYVRQDLPSWLEPYLSRPEVGNALAYVEKPVASAGLVDYARIVVRFLLFPFVGILGTLSDEASYLFDRLSPLISLILPAAAAIGYQFGPRRYAKYKTMIEKAKRTPRKRLKKDRQQKAAKEKKQLV